MSFSDEEVADPRSQRLGRIATVASDGQPDVVPVGYELDGTHLCVGSLDPAKTRKFRNLADSPFTHDHQVRPRRTVHQAVAEHGASPVHTAAQHPHGGLP